MLSVPYNNYHYAYSFTLGLAYHSQNNDFKILRIVSYVEVFGVKLPPAEAEVYTLSTDSWRRSVISFESDSEPNVGSIFQTHAEVCLFFNGALHCVASTQECNFILSFNVNDETFQKILLPDLDEFSPEFYHFDQLVVFKGSLAMVVFVESEFGLIDRYHLWVMSEYGVVESWTKIIVQVAGVDNFFGCTDCGELLFDKGAEVISYDPESLNKNKLGIFIGLDTGLGCTTDLLESLVLLDQHNEAEIEVIEPDSPLSLKENPRETNPSLDACPFRLKYPSLPSWEVQVTNDSGEVESMIIPRSKHVPYMPLTGGKIEVDFVECHSLIESMKNWIWSSSQSSFDRQNKLSHEIELLRNKVESQASNIRTLERCLCSLGPREVGRSSDPVTDAAGVITPPADEEDPMKTTMQSKEDFSQHMKCLALQDSSHYQVRESTTMAASRSKSGHLRSSQQITFNDYDKEEKEKYIEPLVQRQGKRGRL